MKLKRLLNLVLVLFVGQLLFSCSSAEYYRFAAVKPETYEKAKAKTHAGEVVPPAQAEIAIATPAPQAAPAEEAVLEASTNASTPVLFEKKDHKIITSQAVAKKVITQPAELTANDAKLLATAESRLAKMTKTEKKELKKEIKEALDTNRAATNIVEIILAILLPPLGVFLHEGEVNSRFWISLLLTLLLFIPGVIYALLVVTDSI